MLLLVKNPTLSLRWKIPENVVSARRPEVITVARDGHQGYWKVPPNGHKFFGSLELTIGPKFHQKLVTWLKVWEEEIGKLGIWKLPVIKLPKIFGRKAFYLAGVGGNKFFQLAKLGLLTKYKALPDGEGVTKLT